jgi:hypothetical protein
MNTPIVGRIYDIVDKTTGEIVKVGSTIRSLKKRFSYPDYRTKYVNHFIREFKTIQSSDADWYEQGNPFCPFLWHLVASEHIRMLEAGTYRKDRFSNKWSPLNQKYHGFDGTTRTFSEDERKKQSDWMKNQALLGVGVHSLESHKRMAEAKKGVPRTMSEEALKEIALKISKAKKGVPFSDEHRRKCAEGHKGRPHSKEHKRKISEGNKGKIRSEETRRKLSECRRGQSLSEETKQKLSMINLGKHHSQETRKKMSETRKGRDMTVPIHCRYHVSRNRPNPRCVLCSEQSLVVAYA